MGCGDDGTNVKHTALSPALSPSRGEPAVEIDATTPPDTAANTAHVADAADTYDPVLSRARHAVRHLEESVAALRAGADGDGGGDSMAAAVAVAVAAADPLEQKKRKVQARIKELEGRLEECVPFRCRRHPCVPLVSS